MVYMIDIYANYTNIVFLISRINQCPRKPLPEVVRTVVYRGVWVGGCVTVSVWVVWCGVVYGMVWSPVRSSMEGLQIVAAASGHYCKAKTPV